MMRVGRWTVHLFAKPTERSPRLPPRLVFISTRMRGRLSFGSVVNYRKSLVSLPAGDGLVRAAPMRPARTRDYYPWIACGIDSVF